jgi:predicted lysophospholipase L1 biosynthesis ABC-type transport system permease subunit
VNWLHLVEAILIVVGVLGLIIGLVVFDVIEWVLMVVLAVLVVVTPTMILYSVLQGNR